MTWVSPPTFVSTADLSAIDPGSMQVLIIGIDRLATRDLERLRTRTWAVPVITVGADAGIPGAQVLSSKLTSRELKHALRTTLAAAARRPESAVV